MNTHANSDAAIDNSSSTQEKLNYAGVVKLYLAIKNIPGSPQIIHSSTPSSNLAGGFIGVKRKRRPKCKQFFLSGIAETVNKDQIFSYLATKGITLTNIFTFQSKRRGTISAKISIPSVSSSRVLEKNFWPEHVLCKPWLQNENKPSAGNSKSTHNG